MSPRRRATTRYSAVSAGFDALMMRSTSECTGAAKALRKRGKFVQRVVKCLFAHPASDGKSSASKATVDAVEPTGSMASESSREEGDQPE